jgi:hypothetical protein
MYGRVFLYSAAIAAGVTVGRVAALSVLETGAYYALQWVKHNEQQLEKKRTRRESEEIANAN